MNIGQIMQEWELDEDGSLRTLRMEGDGILPTFFCPPMEAGRVTSNERGQRIAMLDYEGAR